MSNYVDYDNAVELFTEVGNKRKASESMQESLLKSTVGWTGKNRFAVKLADVKANNTSTGTWSGNTYTLNGLTAVFTTDANDYITEIKITGTSTGSVVFRFLSNAQFDSHDFVNMIINGLPASATQGWNGICYRFWKSDDSASFNLVNEGAVQDIGACNFGVRMASGFTCPSEGYVIYPMLRDASITDDTYEPYHESVEEEIEQIYADNGVLGAKNLMHYPYNELKTSVDVTLTVDSDGVINLNGTQGSSAQGQYYLSRRFNYDFQLPAGTYILTGGSSDTWLDIGVNNVTGDASQGSTTLGQDRGNGFTFTLTKLSDIQVILFIDKNKTFSNKKIYPMIRLVSDPNDTYVPYAMTNREITEELTVQESAVTDIIEGATVGSDYGNHLIKKGKIVQLVLRLTGVSAQQWATIICKIPEGYRPKYRTAFRDVNASKFLYCMPSGIIQSAAGDFTNTELMISATWITD